MLILDAFLLSLIAGLATGLGGGIVALAGKPSIRFYDALLGFAAGVMTAIATLGLISEALTLGGTVVSTLGVTLGAFILFIFDHFLPHEHLNTEFANHQPKIVCRRGLMIFAAITLHNLPEGLSMGTSYMANPQLGLVLIIAIALHNIPEGIAVAAPFRAYGMSGWQCIAWALGSGLVEPVAALIGAIFVTLIQPLLPISLAFAGGAMLYVVSDELIPESHSHGYEHEATLGFIIGFLLLLALLRLVE